VARDTRNDAPNTIVGVAENVTGEELRAPPVPQMYLSALRFVVLALLASRIPAARAVRSDPSLHCVMNERSSRVRCQGAIDIVCVL